MEVAFLNFIRMVRNQDFWSWIYNKSGEYSVKSGYWLASKENNSKVHQEAMIQPSINDLKDKVWHHQTMPKIKVFLWRAMSGALPVAAQFLARSMQSDPRCQACGLEIESVNHVLFTCSIARQVWALSEVPILEGGFGYELLNSNINYILVSYKSLIISSEIQKLVPWIMWRLWKNKNLFFFEAKSFSHLNTIQKIKEDMEFWFMSQCV